MPKNDAAAPGQVCPGIRIHAIDIVQPPGIRIPPIADMEAPQTIVAAALPAKSSADTPTNACWEARRGDRRDDTRLGISPSAQEQLAGVITATTFAQRLSYSS
jgi:hypothetical protein